MSTKANELKLDVEELSKLLQQTSRQKVKDILNIEIRKLQTELNKLLEDHDHKNTSIEPSVNEPSPSGTVNSCKTYEVKINNYGWDQTPTILKLYVTLEDVQQFPKESVVCNFTDKSLELRVLGINNKTYVFTVNNLCEEIEVSKCTFKVKKDMVIISLVKKESKMWSHVTGVEKGIKTSKLFKDPDMGNEDDDDYFPENIMNIMKKLYTEGDDELKKKIAKAWSENQAVLS